MHFLLLLLPLHGLTREHMNFLFHFYINLFRLLQGRSVNSYFLPNFKNLRVKLQNTHRRIQALYEPHPLREVRPQVVTTDPSLNINKTSSSVFNYYRACVNRAYAELPSKE